MIINTFFQNLTCMKILIVISLKLKMIIKKIYYQKVQNST